MFLCELSMTLCLIYKTKSSEQSSDMIRDAIKNKLSTYFFTLGSFWYLYKDANVLFKPNTSKRKFFYSICPNSRQTRVHGLCQKVNVHLYTAPSVDKIAAVIIISICFWRVATLTFSAFRCQLLGSQWAGPKSMCCSGGSVYANDCDVKLSLGSKMSHIT